MTSPPGPVAPSRSDAVAAGASRLLGGPLGRHATGRSHRWWTPLRAVLVLTILTSALGFALKAPCRTHPWAGEYQYTRGCYTDVFALYYAEHLGAGPGGTRMSVPYRDHPVEYPAVIGEVMWAAAAVTNAVSPARADGTADDHRGRVFFDVTALLLAVSALVVAWGVARLAGRHRTWDAAMFALAPALLLHAYTNWDLVAVALATAGMAVWSRARRWPGHLGAGVLLGLGVATKLYPVLILLALLLVAVRARRLQAWAVAAAGSAAGLVAGYLPAWVLSAQTPAGLARTAFRFPDAACPHAHVLPGWRWFWSLNQVRGADWDSLWFQLQHARGTLDAPACGTAPRVLDTGVAVATLAVVAAVAALALLAPRRPRVAQVAFLLVAGFLLVNKVDSPQYVLWLVPLAVLARPRWPAFLAWQAAEALVLVARFAFFVDNDASIAGRGPQGVPISWFFAAVDVRDLTLLVLVALVVREVLRPRHDVVRAGGVDDPAGGVLALPARAPRRAPPGAPA